MATQKTKRKTPKSKQASPRHSPARKGRGPTRGGKGKVPHRPKLRRQPVVRPVPAENPEAKALAGRIAALLVDKKALDVVILDVRGRTSYADYFVVASGESERQVSAMADHVDFTLKQGGKLPIGVEGTELGQWVLMDYGEVLAHLFYVEARAFYDLEGLWADVPREKVA